MTLPAILATVGLGVAAGLLVPYRAGMDCWHALGNAALGVEIDEDEVQRCTISSSPDVAPSFSA